ncbi:hypothetical protein Syun_031221 [Stephania yunnanensis]|uniref:Uncharacterized protein n=1 Tax=Stephania yunnanensis TaxID=152371 RepID=A0AAP0DVC1_9MAGN
MDSRLTFQFLQEQRIRVLKGVSQFMEDVCSRAFVDIVQRLAVIREREAASTSVGNQPFVMPTNFGVRPPVVPPMAPAVPPRYVVVQDPMVPQMGAAPMNESLAAQQERTMFMTFSRGYPVSEAEVRDYFTGNYGDCIDSFHMEEVEANQQALYARYLETGTLPPSAQPNALENLIPTIRGLKDSRITFQFLQEQRIRVLNGVSQFMEDVCSRAFVDIVERLAVIREREAASTSVGNQPFVMPTNFGVRPPVVPPMAPAVPPCCVVVQDPMVPQMGVAPDFYAFHTIDRELFARLVIDLRRDPGYSMLSLALFLWFNNIGFPDVVVKLRSLPDAVVDVVGEEATIILRYLETGTLPPSAQPNSLENLIPTIRGLMDSRLTFQFLQEQRIRVLKGVSQFMEDVCSRAFVDIVQRLAVIREREAASTSVGNQPFVMPTNFGVRPPVVPPMAPAVPPRYVVVQDPMVPQMGAAPMNESLAAQQERTMFMTFSRGYPVSEAEVRDYFTRYLETGTLPPSAQPNALENLIPTIQGLMDSRLTFQFLEE